MYISGSIIVTYIVILTIGFYHLYIDVSVIKVNKNFYGMGDIIVMGLISFEFL